MFQKPNGLASLSEGWKSCSRTRHASASRLARRRGIRGVDLRHIIALEVGLDDLKMIEKLAKTSKN